MLELRARQDFEVDEIDDEDDEDDADDVDEIAVESDDDEPGPMFSSPLVGWTFITLFIAALIVAGLIVT